MAGGRTGTGVQPGARSFVEHPAARATHLHRQRHTSGPAGCNARYQAAGIARSAGHSSLRSDHRPAASLWDTSVQGATGRMRACCGTRRHRRGPGVRARRGRLRLGRRPAAGAGATRGALGRNRAAERPDAQPAGIGRSGWSRSWSAARRSSTSCSRSPPERSRRCQASTTPSAPPSRRSPGGGRRSLIPRRPRLC